jgi:hypothetical protein
MTKQWGSDVPVSMPEEVSADKTVRANYGGIGMTDLGPTAVVSRTDLEELLLNFFGPSDWSHADGGDES